jgi:hypothetical protein
MSHVFDEMSVSALYHDADGKSGSNTIACLGRSCVSLRTTDAAIANGGFSNRSLPHHFCAIASVAAAPGSWRRLQNALHLKLLNEANASISGSQH